MISPKEKKGSILIVGQGIAGSLLAYFLLKKNQHVTVLDQPLSGASSKVAAGIINPVTGRRLVKSWRFDELSAHARDTYHSIGQFLGLSIFQEKNILRALPNIFEENEWERRSGFPENKPFFCKTTDLGNYAPVLKPTYAWGEMTGSAKVDMPLLTTAFREYLLGRKLLMEEVFDFGEMRMEGSVVTYRGVYYEKIVFCEGAKAVENPYFKRLPFTTTKGELLLVKIKGLHVGKILKHKVYLVPMQSDIFWVGPTNSFKYQSDEPTPDMLDYLVDSLEEVLDVPYEIISHKSGIRPTVADKRPLLGLHPDHPCLGIFNGLGTKGASLGPLFAEQMARYLLGESLLDPEVDISRFGTFPKTSAD